MNLSLSLNVNQLVFLIGCFVVILGSVLLSYFLLLGTFIGALGMFYFLRWFEPFMIARKKALLVKKVNEVKKLEKELYGKV